MTGSARFIFIPTSRKPILAGHAREGGHPRESPESRGNSWIPAFAGMTSESQYFGRLDFLPVVKGENHCGAVTPQAADGALFSTDLRHDHVAEAAGGFRPDQASRRARGRQDRFAPLAVAFGQS